MGKLNVYTIEHSVNMKDYYSTRGSFIASKLFQKFTEAFINQGKIIYDNNTLIGDFNCTERGLQYAFKLLETNDLFHREFTDETKLNRTGFKINIEQVLEIIELRKKDVEDLKRGDLKKSIVTQMAMTFKRDIRGLRRALTNAKNAKNHAKYQELLDKINKIQEDYRNHVESCILRYEYYRDLEQDEADYNDVLKVHANTLVSWNFEPPELNQN